MVPEPTPQELLDQHRRTAEPLDEEEVRILVEAGLTSWEDWEDRGGGLFWNRLMFADQQE